ncbi:acetyltransferase [Salinisphaera sp. USBA-960]|uniref:GNAT family N-acetyltransferase n=1 Tax=Salinisphaera orenii TaxID=856731 RepID=UPI0013A61483|nr:acetyltransferase [Salifodinibacter halophilus]NNC26040.1 acetyltransferase [Salifodinibacter halophilus]
MSDPKTIAERTVGGVGHLTIRPFAGGNDIAAAHRWLTAPHATFWGMQANREADTKDYFTAINKSATHEAWMGHLDGEPYFLAEVYAPDADAIGDYYPVDAGDIGMHLLIAPPEQYIHGLTWAVFTLVVDTLFAREDVTRIVVEPDVENSGIHVFNERAGFVYERQIAMRDKTAWLATCSRAGHRCAMAELSPVYAALAGRRAGSAATHAATSEVSQ